MILKWYSKRFEVANVGHVIARVKNIDDSGLVALTSETLCEFLKTRKKRN
jgi:peptidyl-prolyl cis-trans isomerase D